MKINLLLAAFAVVMLASCDKDPEPEPTPDVEGCMDATSLNYNADATKDDGSCTYADESYRGLFIKYTGTWCWACGDYGAGVVKDIKSQWGDKVTVIEVHKGSSDPMNNAIADAWTTHWAHSSTPSFVANSTLLSGHPVSPASGVYNAVVNSDPAVGFANEYSFTDGEITGTAHIQALEGLTGDYSIGVYFIGQDYVYKQIGKDGSAHPEWTFDDGTATYPEYHHEDILYGEANNLPFGTEAFTDPVEDQVFTLEYTAYALSNWTEKMDVVLIAWKKDGEKYEFVNSAFYSLED